MMRSRRLTVLAAARKAAPGDVLAARDGAELVCVFRTENGRIYVVPDHCPHDGGLLSDGFVDGSNLVCSRHGWEFEADSGRCPAHDLCVATRRVERRLASSPELAFE